MRKVKLLLTFVLAVLSIFLLVGCNILSDLVKESGGDAPLSQLLNNSQAEDTVPVITSGEQGEQTVALYFADKKGETLVEESRTIPKTLSLARETVNQWLIGPTGATDSYPVVDPQTSLRDIGIKNGIATVDLSKEFLQPYSNISAETALYGLVNTLTQFPTVQIVKIRVEGQEIKTYRSLSTDNLRFRDDMIGYSAGAAVNPTNKTIEDPKIEGTTRDATHDNVSIDDNNGESDNDNEENKTSPSSMDLFEN